MRAGERPLQRPREVSGQTLFAAFVGGTYWHGEAVTGQIKQSDEQGKNGAERMMVQRGSSSIRERNREKTDAERTYADSEMRSSKETRRALSLAGQRLL
jgi:hypothetical protein